MVKTVLFDIDIQKFGKLTGKDRIKYIQKKLPNCPAITVTKPAILVDKTGTIFGWLLPDLLDEQQHVRIRFL